MYHGILAKTSSKVVKKHFVFFFVCRPCVKLNPSTTGTNVFVFLKKKKINEKYHLSFLTVKKQSHYFSEADNDTDIDSVSLSLYTTHHTHVTP